MQHIMIRLSDQRVIAPTAEARCLLARSVLAAGRNFGLLLFRCADSHLHQMAACARHEALELARRIEVSLRKRLALPVPFDRAYVKPVRDQGHARWLVPYILNQEPHHGVDLDPLFVASNLPDLLGMRLLGAYTVNNVRRLLPRVTRSQLLDRLGAAGLDDADAPIDLLDLVDAATAAFALSELNGRREPAAAARRAAVAVASQHLPTAAIAERLSLAPRTVRQLRQRGAPAADVQAVTLQLRLRTSLRLQRAGLLHAPRVGLGAPLTLSAPLTPLGLVPHRVELRSSDPGVG